MSNVTTGNVWKLDTTGVISTSPVYVKSIRYLPDAEADQLIILDNGGNEIWNHVAIAAGDDIDYWLEVNGSVNGINLSTLSTSGVVWIYIR